MDEFANVTNSGPRRPAPAHRPDAGGADEPACAAAEVATEGLDALELLTRQAERIATAEPDAARPHRGPVVSDALPLATLFPARRSSAAPEEAAGEGSPVPAATPVAALGSTTDGAEPLQALDEAAIARLLREIQTGFDLPATALPTAGAAASPGTTAQGADATRDHTGRGLTTLATARRMVSTDAAVPSSFELSLAAPTPDLPAVIAEPAASAVVGSPVASAVEPVAIARPSGAPGFIFGLASAGAVGALLYVYLSS